MKTIRNMTVDVLKDIILSQMTIYCNAPLYVKNKHDFDSFTLFAGNEPILECFGFDDTDIEEHSLATTYDTLCELESSGAITNETTIICGDAVIQNEGFKIGFMTKSDGFIETISSKELETLVAEF